MRVGFRSLAKRNLGEDRVRAALDRERKSDFMKAGVGSRRTGDILWGRN
jgi:hypothetical protein